LKVDILDQFKLDGRVALVTGAGSGIGEAISQAMAEAGAAVACVDINSGAAQEAAAHVRTLGKRAVAITADVSKEPDVVRMVESTVKELGTVDIAFANAAYDTGAFPLIDSSLEPWQRGIDVVLTSVYLTAREVAKVMVPKRSGKIIATASIMGFKTMFTPVSNFSYSAAKAGVVNLIRSLGVELAQYNIQANGIAPGFTRTNISGGFLKEESSPFIEEIKARIPIHRLAEPDEYKGIALFLASPASDLMTGFTVVVDGGFLAC
jgi:NAD(P)-dependent dehydrogenase (short-subunit alcohol dehydrogenase family)